MPRIGINMMVVALFALIIILTITGLYSSTQKEGLISSSSSMVGPVIHYTFDGDGTNYGTLGSSHNLIIPSDFSIDIGDPKFGTGCLSTRATGQDNKTGFTRWTSTSESGFTVSLWSKCSLFIGKNQTLFEMVIDNKNLVVGFNTPTNFRLYFNGTNTYPTIPNTFDNMYHNFTFTFSDKTMQSYIDNVLVNTQTFNDSFTKKTITQWFIGSSLENNVILHNGLIDDCIIYDYVLDSTQINDIYSGKASQQQAAPQQQAAAPQQAAAAPQQQASAEPSIIGMETPIFNNQYGGQPGGPRPIIINVHNNGGSFGPQGNLGGPRNMNNNTNNYRIRHELGDNTNQKLDKTVNFLEFIMQKSQGVPQAN